MRQKEVVTVAFAFLFAPVQGAISPSLALTTRVVAAHGPAVSAADIHHHHQPARSAQGKNHTDWVALSDWLARHVRVVNDRRHIDSVCSYFSSDHEAMR